MPLNHTAPPNNQFAVSNKILYFMWERLTQLTRPEMQRYNDCTFLTFDYYPLEWTRNLM